MLIANNISKEYITTKFSVKHLKLERTQKTAVHNLSLKIPSGKIIGLLGVNGAGKSTTIRILSSLVSPTSGSVEIDGVNVSSNPQKIKSIINVISGGERNLYWRLTGRQNLEYFGKLYGLSGKKLDKRVNSALEIVNLLESADLEVEKYSKGMKQRLQIARGLINDPNYLFLDEPTLGLDVIVAKDFRRYIKRLASTGKGILLTTHYLSEADELCDFVYVINRGSIIAKGTPEQLKSQNTSANEYILTFNNNIAPSILTKFRHLDFIDNANLVGDSLSLKMIPDFLPDALRICSDLRVSPSSVTRVEPSLEDSIISLLERGGS